MIISNVDISPQDFKFNPNFGRSLRDSARDLVDKFFRRPYYKFRYKDKLSNLPCRVDLILPSKGLSKLAKRSLVDRHIQLKNSRLLVVGCGDAWDFSTYLNFEPKDLVGVDLYNFQRCWDNVINYAYSSNLVTNVEFYQTDIAQLENKISGQFDVIFSDAVFEHCVNLNSSLVSLYDLLKPGGIIYASYGPLWYCWGGDHFSGRGGLENGFNHLLLDSIDYKKYYIKYLKESEFELQNGGRYIELDLFSKLSSNEYLKLYNDMGFNIKQLIVDIDLRGEKLLTPQFLKKLLDKYPNLHPNDFMIKGHTILLEK